MKPDLREAFFWAAAANNNARIRPRGELTLEKVSRLAQIIRERLLTTLRPRRDLPSPG